MNPLELAWSRSSDRDLRPELVDLVYHHAATEESLEALVAWGAAYVTAWARLGSIEITPATARASAVDALMLVFAGRASRTTKRRMSMVRVTVERRARELHVRPATVGKLRKAMVTMYADRFREGMERLRQVQREILVPSDRHNFSQGSESDRLSSGRAVPRRPGQPWDASENMSDDMLMPESVAVLIVRIGQVEADARRDAGLADWPAVLAFERDCRIGHDTNGTERHEGTAA